MTSWPSRRISRSLWKAWAASGSAWRSATVTASWPPPCVPWNGTPKRTPTCGFWRLWQRNDLDGRQAAINRAALAYGVAYGTALPGKDDLMFFILSTRMMPPIAIVQAIMPGSRAK